MDKPAGKTKAPKQLRPELFAVVGQWPLMTGAAFFLSCMPSGISGRWWLGGIWEVPVKFARHFLISSRATRNARYTIVRFGFS
jgi:hypothetical protein